MVDWEKIEAEYRAGQLSVREIARQHGFKSDNAVRKRAKAEGWERDLTEQVREAVRSRLVRSEVRTLNVREAIDSAATRGVEVVMSHRRDVGAARSMFATLLGQLVEASAKREEIEETIFEETAGDANGKRRAMMLSAVSLPSHAGVLKDLSMSLKALVPLERQAFNLNDKVEDAASDFAEIVERARKRADG